MTAKLNGFEIHVEPHANIRRSDQHSVFGILVHPTHEELNTLNPMDGVGVFLPEAVIIETTEGRLQPVLCYISPTRNNHPADLEYLGNLIAVATEYGFPIGSSNASQASETNDNQTTGDAMPPIRIGHKRSRITDWALRLGPECGGLKDAMGRVITRHYGAVMIRTSSIS